MSRVRSTAIIGSLMLDNCHSFTVRVVCPPEMGRERCRQPETSTDHQDSAFRRERQGIRGGRQVRQGENVHRVSNSEASHIGLAPWLDVQRRL